MFRPLILLIFLTLRLAAANPQEFRNSADARRYHHLIGEIRCPTCQNSNIAESSAPLARQLRQLVAEQIRAGRSDGEIDQYLRQRYGDFISYRPPLLGSGLLLWLLPLLLMALALRPLLAVVRRRRGLKGDFTNRESAPLSVKLPLTNRGSAPLHVNAAAEAPKESLTNRRALPIYVNGAKLPRSLRPLLLVLLALAGLGWWQLSGQYYFRWRQLTAGLEADLNRSQYLGQLPEWLGENGLVFCLALQERIDASDRDQLEHLGHCFVQGQFYGEARPIYQRLMQLSPSSQKYRLAFAQSDIFSAGQLSASTEALLRELVKEGQQGAQLLLATAYEGEGRSAEALELWQGLAALDPHSTLGQLAAPALARFRRTVNLQLKADTRAALPPNALIFLTLEQEGKTVARRLLPLLAQQQVQFTAVDYVAPLQPKPLLVKIKIATAAAAPVLRSLERTSGADPLNLEL